MANYVYEAKVRLSNGNEQKVQVQASSEQNARAMLETYGRLLTTPSRKS
jgi:type II secretory pathway component PulF